MTKDKEFRFGIVERFGEFTEEIKGWKGEVNMVSWNDREPKIDIRRWNEDHTSMSKGISMTIEEARMLAEILNRI